MGFPRCDCKGKEFCNECDTSDDVREEPKMDPNENLRQQRACVLRIRALRASRFSTGLQPLINEAEKLAELVEALDNWLTNNGWLPSAWQVSARTVRR